MARTNKQTNETNEVNSFWLGKGKFVHFTVSILACFGFAILFPSVRHFLFLSLVLPSCSLFRQLYLNCEGKMRVPRLLYFLSFFRLFSSFFSRVCICTSVFAFKWLLFVHLNVCLWCTPLWLLVMWCGIWVKCRPITTKCSACFRLRIAHFIVWLLASLVRCFRFLGHISVGSCFANSTAQSVLFTNVKLNQMKKTHWTLKQIQESKTKRKKIFEEQEDDDEGRKKIVGKETWTKWTLIHWKSHHTHTTSGQQKCELALLFRMRNVNKHVETACANSELTRNDKSPNKYTP